MSDDLIILKQLHSKQEEVHLKQISQIQQLKELSTADEKSSDFDKILQMP